MINELSLQPFNKLNCMGMLNTLLPPLSPGGNARLPTPLLTHQLLRDERDSFFEYIRRVQKSGPAVLHPVIELNKSPGDETGWDNVQKTVDKYLRVAKNMIDDCIATTGTEDFTKVEESRKGKKTDSGVSFGSEQRPSTGSSAMEKPLPVMPADPKPAPKGLSKLERITREFRRMRVKTRVDVEEIVKVDRQSGPKQQPPRAEAETPSPKKSLRKARSFANLAHLRSTNASSTSLVGSRKASDPPPFDAKEMRHRRMVYEASTTARGSKNLI
jgi:hypothetical protein